MDRQKKGILVLAVAGIFALLAGFWQIGHNIKAPFIIKKIFKKTQNQEETIFDLQVKDTDGDSITDYDELYIHKTSPYLEDTDSDGASDKDEIVAGSDPNCPEGANCGGVGTAERRSTETGGIFDMPDSFGGGLDAIEGSEVGATEKLTSDDKEFLENLSIDQVKELLLSAGMKQEDLAKLSDEALIGIYEEALSESIVD